MRLSLALALGLLALYCDLCGGLQSGTSITSITSSGTVIRLRARLRRPEICRENLSSRRSEDLPPLVIVGRIKEVYQVNENGQQQLVSSPLEPVGPQSSLPQRALVTVGRVIKGNNELLGSEILVTGFNGTNSTPCANFIKANDSWIMLLNNDGDRRYSIQASNLLSMNLNNLDRINAIAADEPYKRRPPIEDILCEAHYCPYGRCVASERGQLTCHCPDSCSPIPSPVCGSDNTTYTNECHLIKEGCRRQKPLFVTKEMPC